MQMTTKDHVSISGVQCHAHRTISKLNMVKAQLLVIRLMLYAPLCILGGPQMVTKSFQSDLMESPFEPVVDNDRPTPPPPPNNIAIAIVLLYYILYFTKLNSSDMLRLSVVC